MRPASRIIQSTLLPISVQGIGEQPADARSKSPFGRAEMDFDKAIASHSQWKGKLATYLRKPDHSLQPNDILPDNKCDLGKWIIADGAKMASEPEFSKLKSEHTRFHKAAADIVRRANAGEKVAEETALGTSSEFTNASSAVVQGLMHMKTKFKS
jgi:Chemoreceptor zinc-binding domain